MATTLGPAGIAMGSVGSLLERQDFSPEELQAALAGSRGARQPDGLLRKGLGQRELLSYLHLPKKDGKSTKRVPRNEAANYTTLYSREHPRAGDFSKTSLPERGRFDKCRIRPSVFKPAGGTGKGFLSMQSLAAHKGQKLWRSNGSLHTLACHPPLSPGPRAKLLQERLRGQEQALRFEQERRTWQEEKERVLRYQREIQGGYMDMYRRNQALEQELRALREPQTPWGPRLESSKI
ncbi:NEDD4-binding protein 3 [Fukomys damarensis]|uniref:NEDD4-binding protein 3 n=1 Tax=Fukomys damarensis TaxID=885580 RepID=UPI0005400E9F|nr:NEDD4-binding protein 3 [Fukomys damarensis]